MKATTLFTSRHGRLFISLSCITSVLSKGPNLHEFLSVCINFVLCKLGFNFCTGPLHLPLHLLYNLNLTLDNISLYSNFLLFGDFNIDVSDKNCLYCQLFSVIDLFSFPTGPTRITTLSID